MRHPPNVSGVVCSARSPCTISVNEVSFGALGAREGGGGRGSPCRMSILRKGNVALSNLRMPLSHVNSEKLPCLMSYNDYLK